jgi:hypothetical protein
LASAFRVKFTTNIGVETLLLECLEHKKTPVRCTGVFLS